VCNVDGESLREIAIHNFEKSKKKLKNRNLCSRLWMNNGVYLDRCKQPSTLTNIPESQLVTWSSRHMVNVTQIF